MMNKARKGVAAEKSFRTGRKAALSGRHDADVTALRQQLGLPEGKKFVPHSASHRRKQGLEKVLTPRNGIHADRDRRFSRLSASGKAAGEHGFPRTRPAKY